MKNFIAKTKQKINKAAVQVKCTTMNLMADIRGESQNTSNAGGAIVSLVVIALVIGFSSGFLQNTFFPWVGKEFKNISG